MQSWWPNRGSIPLHINSAFLKTERKKRKRRRNKGERDFLSLERMTPLDSKSLTDLAEEREFWEGRGTERMNVCGS
jgi:hypothetical protein